RDERAAGTPVADASPADGPGVRDPYIRASMAQNEAGYEAGVPPAAPGSDDRSARAGSRASEQRSARQVQIPVPSSIHTTAAGEMAVAPSEHTPDLPSINVDRITSAIGANARARADSIGRTTMTVKPPVFDQRRP
ncbi:MAG TPA: hypothetical protein VIQ60_07215, partial [Gemmatimonadaceae bacterium]